ncbi:hypothetical protein C6P40_005061, partial [Pichia californica]
MAGSIKPLTPSSALFDDSINPPSSSQSPPPPQQQQQQQQKPPSYNSTINLNHNTENTINVNVQSINSNRNSNSNSNSNDNSLISSSPNSNLTNSSRRFSFNKRQILKSNNKIQRKSSQISFINNYPPQRCDSVDHDIDHTKFYSKYKGIMKDKDELPDEFINNLNFEYNYDNKIRAPRISSANFLSSNDLNNNNNNN